MLRRTLPGSGSERATPRHGYGGTRFYDRSAAGASGPVHEGGAVLAEASRGEPPRESNRSRAELDSKVNVRLGRCLWNVTIEPLCYPLGADSFDVRAFHSPSSLHYFSFSVRRNICFGDGTACTYFRSRRIHILFTAVELSTHCMRPSSCR